MKNALLNPYLVCGILAFTLGLLHFGKPLLIPFTVAIVIWYLIITLKNGIRAIPAVGRYLPGSIALIFSFVVIFAVFWVVTNIITNNVTSLITLAPAYAARFAAIKNDLFALAGITEPPTINDALNNLNLTSWMTGLASTMADIATNVFIIAIYVIFLLLEYQSFDLKIERLARTEEGIERARDIVQKVSFQIQSYLKIKILVSLLTGVLSYLFLVAVGVDFADFWALLIFMLNFIPNIGSFIATIFPCLIALIQFETFTPFFITLAGLSSIQFTVGNFLEPKLMGNSFNLSPLAIILALAIWGYLWGIVGMFLCVPILVIVNIIFSNFEKTRPIAILLSREGDIK